MTWQGDAVLKLTSNFVIRVACPLCSTKQSRIVHYEALDTAGLQSYVKSYYRNWTADGFMSPQASYDFPYALARCEHCCLVFQTNILSDDNLALVYGKWLSTDWHKALWRESLDSGLHRVEDVIKLLRLLDRPPRDLRFLDFGSGSGQWLRLARAFGVHAYGYDLSERLAESVAQSDINFISRLEDLESGTFDVVNADQVLEHVANPRDVLNKLFDLLRPFGLLKIGVPPYDGSQATLRRILATWKDVSRKGSPLDPVEHINMYERRTFQVIAREWNAEIVSMPLAIEYSYALGWDSVRGAAKNILLPFMKRFGYRHHVYLRKIR